MIKSELVQQHLDAKPASLSARRREHRQRHPQRDHRGDGARRPGRAARLRRLLGQEPAGAHRPQSAHRRACLGRAEVRAVLQDRQGNARAAEQAATRRSPQASRARRRLSSGDTKVECMRKFLPSPSSWSRSRIVIVMFAVANREIVTVSFDPFDSAHPAFVAEAAAVRADFRAGRSRRRGRRHRGLAAAAANGGAGAPRRSRGARPARASSTPERRARNRAGARARCAAVRRAAAAAS